MRNFKSKILIAEEYPLVEPLISQSLGTENYEIQQVGTKAALINKLHSFNPDLVIIDERFAGEDEVELCEEIKKLKPGDLVILLATWLDLDNKYKNCQADDIIEKTQELKNLTTVIKSFLD